MATPVSRGPESRRLFVNREELIVEFLRRIHETPKNDILILYGEAGIGKSSLLDQFEEHYARLLDSPKNQLIEPWMNISGLPCRELVPAFRSRMSHALPCARINFWEPGLGKNLRDAFFGLQAIRQGLNCPAPMFQSACLLYVHATQGLTKEWMAEFFPGDKADFSVGLLDQPWTTSGLTSALHLVAHGAAGVAMPPVAIAALARGLWGYWAHAHAPKAALEKARKELGSAIQNLASWKASELLDELPRLLAEDINASRTAENDDPENSARRFILLFDAYDRFIGSEHHLSPRDRGERHRWFRDFLIHLKPGLGTVVVVTGQEPPAWAKDIAVAARPFEYLPTQDARTFLEKAAVEPEACREALIRYSTVAPDTVQPLFLALLVDSNRVGTERGMPLDPAHLSENLTVQEKQREIVDRLLGSADNELRGAIRALAACRSFDWNSFRGLGGRLAFASTRVRFDTLTSLSFVRSGEDGRFLVHSLIRRFLGGANATRDVHETCLEYYSGDENSVADTVYHQYFLDPEAAADMWVEAFTKASRSSAHERCLALLGVRADLPPSFAMQFAVQFAHELGEYLSRLSRYADAEDEFALATQNPNLESSQACIVQGDLLAEWAALRAKKADYSGAEEKYEAALAAYNRGLTLAHYGTTAYNNKGLALSTWGRLRAQLGDFRGAGEKYETAVAAFDSALTTAPNDSTTHHNKGGALLGWADLRARQGDYADAEYKFETALASFDRALTLAPSSILTLNGKGLTLNNWAVLNAREADQARAEEKYQAALSSFDRALTLAPEFIEAHHNRGVVMQGWAELRALNGDDDEADEKYKESVASYNRSLTLAPKYIEAFNNKGNALLGWADLRAGQTDYVPAEQTYEAAVACYDQALALAPTYIEALNNKGLALRNWGMMETMRNLTAQAFDLFRRSSDAALSALGASATPESYQLLVVNNVSLSAIVAFHEACPLLKEAAVLCRYWEQSFRWDRDRVTAAQDLVAAASKRRGCESSPPMRTNVLQDFEKET